MAGHFQSAFCRRQTPCTRNDLKAPLLIFGGLLLAATAVRALDASSAAAVEDVKVLRAETPYIPVEADLMMGGCQGSRKVSFKKSGRCRTNQVSNQ